jgi:hypothetical protein
MAMCPLEAVTGLPARMTLASNRLFAAALSLTRAAMPMPATTVAQINDTTTILRWVVRSAVNIEVLFMTLSRLSRVLPAHWLHRAELRFTSRRPTHNNKRRRAHPPNGHAAQTPRLQ